MSRPHRPARLAAGAALTLTLAFGAVRADAETRTPSPDADAAARGYAFLTNVPALPFDFDEETFSALPGTWPEPLQGRAEAADPGTRRMLAFARYGLTRRPERIAADPTPAGDEPPLQYVVTPDGRFVMNCLSCHGGTVLGSPYPGAPNNLFALQTLSEEVRDVKLDAGKPLERMDLASLAFPLGSSDGTTNAVMFGVALMHYRDVDLNVHDERLPPKLIHHDMDAPPWWQFAKKTHLYADAFAPKSPRSLMQFMLVRENGPEFFARHEEDFDDVYAYLMSIRPPASPLPVEAALADRGRSVFANRCAECHGTYDADEAKETYPGRIVPIEEIGTDPVRLAALTPDQRSAYGRSWFAREDAAAVVRDPGGYVAPPLDGVWASAPYFHNGSVPTLWHVLHPAERPAVWRRAETPGPDVGAAVDRFAGYDRERIGLDVESIADVPADLAPADVRRQVFDTRRKGKSAAGHAFVDELPEDEKRAVLEYLKTL